MKCDEEKPACLRCRCTGRTCDGYASKRPTNTSSSKDEPAIALRQSLVANQPILPNPSTSIPGNERERRSFEFYVLKLGQDVSDSMRLFSLHDLIYQLSHQSSAIREAVTALGSLGERFHLNKLLTIEHEQANACHEYALLQYGKALKHLNEDILTETNLSESRILITCFLFTVFEFLQGNDTAARAHLRSGLNILHGASETQLPRAVMSWAQNSSDSEDINLDLSLNEIRDICACGMLLCGNNKWQDLTLGKNHESHTSPHTPGWLANHKSASPNRDPTVCELLRAFVVMENTAVVWLGLDEWESPLLAPMGVRNEGPEYLDFFPSISDAADALNFLILQIRDLRRCFISSTFQPRERFVPIIRAKRNDLLSRLQRWRRGMDQLRTQLGSLCAGDVLHKVLVMRANYETTFINLTLLSYEQHDCATEAETDLLCDLENRFESITSVARFVLTSVGDTTLSSAPSTTPLSFILLKEDEPDHLSTSNSSVTSKGGLGSGRPSPSPSKTRVMGMFSFCTGLIQPLYMTAVRCRDARIMDEAVRLLETKPWRESAWDSKSMARIARRIRKERGGL